MTVDAGAIAADEAGKTGGPGGGLPPATGLKSQIRIHCFNFLEYHLILECPC
jgi:hypothetical protein